MTTSTINPNNPPANTPLASSVVRANFLAAYNDINALWAALSGSQAYYQWQVAVSDTVLADGFGYVQSTSGTVNFSLPPTATVGDHYKIVGYGSGGWVIKQNAGQTIYFGNQSTTTGTGGSLSSQNRYDGIELVCTATNTSFVVVAAQGQLAGA